MLKRFGGTLLVAALGCVAGSGQRAAAQSDAPPILTLSRSGPTVFVTWFGDDGVAYQLETSPDLTAFSKLGPVTVGTGNFVSFPFPIAGETRRFFLLKRLPAQAVFDPQTGVLDIVGDDLDNTIVVSRDPGGNLLIAGGEVSI